MVPEEAIRLEVFVVVTVKSLIVVVANVDVPFTVSVPPTV